MLIRLIPLGALAVALALGGCGTDNADGPMPASATTQAPTTVPAGPTTSGAPSADSPATTVAPPDLTLFIAAVDAALVDTAYSGAALTDPEVFIATGQLFCELLDDGASRDDILSEHLDALAAVGDGNVNDADATASGVVMGASTEVICPQHRG